MEKKAWVNTPKFTPAQLIVYTAGILITLAALTGWYNELDIYWRMLIFVVYSMILLLFGLPSGKLKELVEKGINIFLDENKTMDMKLKLLMPLWLIISHLIGAVFPENTNSSIPAETKLESTSGTDYTTIEDQLPKENKE